MNPRRYYVTNGHGGFSELFYWHDAEELCIEQSSEDSHAWIIQDAETSDYVALFFGGARWIKASGSICEGCDKVLDADTAHYANKLTGHFFCSQDCGLKIGALVDKG